MDPINAHLFQDGPVCLRLLLVLQSKTSVSDSCASGDESIVGRSSKTNHTYLNTGFLSPLSNDKSSLNNQMSGFSPSIFLSRPDQSTSAVTSTLPHNEGYDSGVKDVTSDGAGYQSPMSDVESVQSQPVEGVCVWVGCSGRRWV